MKRFFFVAVLFATCQAVGQSWDAESYADGNQFQVAIGKALIQNEMDVRGKFVIDVGSGTGEVTAELKAKGASQVIGIDQDANMVRYAQQHYSEIEFRRGGAQELQNDLVETADVVSTFFMLHWLDPKQQHDALSNFYSYLKPGGELVVIVSGAQGDASLRAMQSAKAPHKALWNLIGLDPYLAWHGLPAFWQFFRLSPEQKTQLVGRHVVDKDAVVQQLAAIGFVDIEAILKIDDQELTVDELIQFQLPIVESRGAMRLIEDLEARKTIAANYIKYFLAPELCTAGNKLLYDMPRIFIRARKKEL